MFDFFVYFEIQKFAWPCLCISLSLLNLVNCFNFLAYFSPKPAHFKMLFVITYVLISANFPTENALRLLMGSLFLHFSFLFLLALHTEENWGFVLHLGDQLSQFALDGQVAETRNFQCWTWDVLGKLRRFGYSACPSLSRSFIASYQCLTPSNFSICVLIILLK